MAKKKEETGLQKTGKVLGGIARGVPVVIGVLLSVMGLLAAGAIIYIAVKAGFWICGL